MHISIVFRLFWRFIPIYCVSSFFDEIILFPADLKKILFFFTIFTFSWSKKSTFMYYSNSSLNVVRKDMINDVSARNLSKKRKKCQSTQIKQKTFYRNRRQNVTKHNDVWCCWNTVEPNSTSDLNGVKICHQRWDEKAIVMMMKCISFLFICLEFEKKKFTSRFSECSKKWMARSHDRSSPKSVKFAC